MEFTYSEDYSPVHDAGKQTLLKIVGDSVYIHTKREVDGRVRVNHIRNPSCMILCENNTRYLGAPEYKGQGHFSLIDSVQCHPNSYTEILNKLLHIPDFTRAEVLNLSDKKITIWEKGLEVNNTKYEAVVGGVNIRPIRFFLARNNINSIEGNGCTLYNGRTGYQIIINECQIQIGKRDITNTAMTFTNEEEYKTALAFLIDNLFSGDNSTKDLLDLGSL